MLGELPGGRSALHRPDLALIGPDDQRVAVEVEQSVKASRRLQTICRGYARARPFGFVNDKIRTPGADERVAAE